MSKLHYLSNCVDWPERDVHIAGGLVDMIERAVEVTRRTFLQHVDRVQLKEIAAELGYADRPSQGLTMAGDWAISYHRSKLHDKTVYYFRWSAIEYVFA